MNENQNKYAGKGLSASQVESSRREHGSNSLTAQKRNSFFKQFLSSFGDPIIKILLVALAINIIFLFQKSDWYESAGIALAVFLATFVSTLSEYGSESAFEKLKQEAEKVRCRVIRNGKVLSLAIGEIVVGDVVLLQPGERVPADGVIIWGEIGVDQSPLNGESKEVKKYPGKYNDEWDLSHHTQLFSGSNVSSGEAVMEVAKVGDHTFYGNMAQAMQDKTRESPLKMRLSGLAKLISKMGYCAAILVAAADLFHNIIMENNFDINLIIAQLQDFSNLGLHILHAFTLAITVIVVAVPEGLPMMITVVLSSNMKKMLKDNVLVRKLVGIETSGSMNILFTDKTGTLTKGRLEVSKIVTGDGKVYESAASLKNHRNLYKLYCMSSLLNSQSIVSNGKPLGGNATDRALLQSILPLDLNLNNFKAGQTVPFDSKNKYSLVRLTGEKNLTLVKGAPEKILPKCSKYYDKNGNIQTIFSKGILKTKWNEMTKNKERVVAIAAAEKNTADFENMQGIALIALVAIKDDIRPESKQAVKSVKDAGIQVVMITGDNKDTAIAIGKETGILEKNDKKAVITGDELRALNDNELKALLPDLRIVSRALPTDKSRLIDIAQKSGMVTGMTGDGINDAPALKKSDVGFAMGSGTEVAKEAGDIVIIDNNFKSIGKAVLYGRTIFKSIRKFIVFQLVMNLCAVGVSILGPFIGVDTPVTVIQMLWVNIIMDALAGLAFAGEAALPEYMKEPPKALSEPILSNSMVKQILWIGTYTIILCLVFLKNHVSHQLFSFENNDTTHFMTCFFALFIFCGIFNSFNARTPRINLFAHMKENPLFIFIMISVSIIQILLVYFGGSLFRTVPVPVNEMIFIILLSMTVIPADIIRKLIIKLRNKGQIH